MSSLVDGASTYRHCVSSMQYRHCVVSVCESTAGDKGRPIGKGGSLGYFSPSEAGRYRRKGCCRKRGEDSSMLRATLE